MGWYDCFVISGWRAFGYVYRSLIVECQPQTCAVSTRIGSSAIDSQGPAGSACIWEGRRHSSSTACIQAAFGVPGSRSPSGQNRPGGDAVDSVRREIHHQQLWIGTRVSRYLWRSGPGYKSTHEPPPRGEGCWSGAYLGDERHVEA